MKTFVINGITINCLFTELSEEQKQGAERLQRGIQQYKDLQTKAIQDYFIKAENSKLFLDAGVTSVDVNARIEYIKQSEKFPKGIHPRDLILLPMGLAAYEPLLQKVQNGNRSALSSNRQRAVKHMRERIAGQKEHAKKILVNSRSKKNKTKP